MRNAVTPRQAAVRRDPRAARDARDREPVDLFHVRVELDRRERRRARAREAHAGRGAERRRARRPGRRGPACPGPRRSAARPRSGRSWPGCARSSVRKATNGCAAVDDPLGVRARGRDGLVALLDRLLVADDGDRGRDDRGDDAEPGERGEGDGAATHAPPAARGPPAPSRPTRPAAKSAIAASTPTSVQSTPNRIEANRRVMLVAVPSSARPLPRSASGMCSLPIAIRTPSVAA